MRSSVTARPSMSTSLMATDAPERASSIANACPMPDPAPVTTATLPAKPCMPTPRITIRLVCTLSVPAVSPKSGNERSNVGEGQDMLRIRTLAIAPLALSVGIVGAAATLAAPAQADPGGDAFIGALSSAGLSGIDPATAVSVGQSVCPMLSEPGQQMADVASGV